MSDAIAATFADFKLIKTRKVAQFWFEVPIEEADAALATLGGLPRPDAERWVGITPLKVPAESGAVGEHGSNAGRSAPPARTEGPDKAGHSRRQFASLPRSQQAALMCDRQDFREWVCRVKKWPDLEPTADYVRAACGVDSRANLDTDPAAGARWDKLHNEYLDSKLPEIRR